MTRLLLSSVAASCLLVAAAEVGRAQVDATEEAQKEASQRDEAARTAFRLGEFDKAITEWKEAYRVVSHPVFLYNIAQAYRRKEDLRQSIFFYKQYLQEAPEAGNRAEVEKRIADLEALIEKNKAASAAPPDDPLKTTSSERVEPPPADDSVSPSETTAPAPDETPVARDDGGAKPGRSLKLTGLGVGGAGVALLGTGIVFALKASSAQSDVESAVANNDPWTEELQDKHDSGQSSATIGKVTIGLGVAALATGATLYFLGAREAKRAESSARVTPVVGPGGIGVAFELRY